MADRHDRRAGYPTIRWRSRDVSRETLAVLTVATHQTDRGSRAVAPRSAGALSNGDRISTNVLRTQQERMFHVKRAAVDVRSRRRRFPGVGQSPLTLREPFAPHDRGPPHAPDEGARVPSRLPAPARADSRLQTYVRTLARPDTRPVAPRRACPPARMYPCARVRMDRRRDEHLRFRRRHGCTGAPVHPWALARETFTYAGVTTRACPRWAVLSGGGPLHPRGDADLTPIHGLATRKPHPRKRERGGVLLGAWRGVNLHPAAGFDTQRLRATAEATRAATRRVVEASPVLRAPRPVVQ